MLISYTTDTKFYNNVAKWSNAVKNYYAEIHVLLNEPCRSKIFFTLESSYMTWLALFTLFEYLCYVSMAIINSELFHCGDRLHKSESFNIISTFQF